MTGLLGGGHAIYWDGAAGVEPRLLRHRARPGAARRRRSGGAVRRGARPLRDRAGLLRRAGPSRRARGALGRASAACPGAASSSRRCGSRGRACAMPPAHAACLAMLEPVMTLRPRARAIYAPGGYLLESGDVLAQPGLAGALGDPRRRGRGERLPRARSRRRCSTSTGSRSRTRRSRVVRGAWQRAGHGVVRRARAFHTRGGLAGVAETLARLPTLRGLDEHRPRAGAARRARRRRPASTGTRRTSTRRRRRRARVRADDEPRARHGRLPARLRPAPEQHARRGRPAPRPARARRADGEHDGAELAVDAEGLALAIGSAGGTGCALPSSGSPPGSSTRASSRSTPSTRPRFHPVGGLVNAEPGVDEEALVRLERSGRRVAAGRRSTTTSAASASSAGTARPAIRAAAAMRAEPT